MLFQEFINEYIWYHGFTIAMLSIITILIVVHRWGSEQNINLAKKYKSTIDSTLTKAFKDYDGDLVVESPNIIKLYISGRESCVFGIIAFAVH